jgi:hypothetical protein
MTRRTVERRAVRSAGPNDQVVTLVSKGGDHFVCRHDVCADCPWRLDAPIGNFPSAAFVHSAHTAYDLAGETFACHTQGADRPATCAGFLASQGAHNMAVRLSVITGRLDLSRLRVRVPLYQSYRDMAVANGVCPDDPALRLCRDDGQLTE